MPEEINIGDRYGRLVVMSISGLDKNQHRLWLCQCDCGNTTQTRATGLRRGKCKSCGCLKVDVRKRRSRTQACGSSALDHYLCPGRQDYLLTKEKQ